MFAVAVDPRRVIDLRHKLHPGAPAVLAIFGLHRQCEVHHADRPGYFVVSPDMRWDRWLQILRRSLHGQVHSYGQSSWLTVSRS
jgi:hypothetical protein